MKRFSVIYYEVSGFKQRELEEKNGLPFTGDGSVKVMSQVVRGKDEAEARKAFALLVEKRGLCIDSEIEVTEIKG